MIQVSLWYIIVAFGLGAGIVLSLIYRILQKDPTEYDHLHEGKDNRYDISNKERRKE